METTGFVTQAGITVPPGFVILSSAFEKFLEETDLDVEIDAILHKLDHREIHTIENASEEIKALILEAKMPEDIAIEIKTYFEKLDTKYVAVRSRGGITCHAAIVARELKKPCIIGTKIATQVLKDEDQVEVDADNGLIRILK